VEGLGSVGYRFPFRLSNPEPQVPIPKKISLPMIKSANVFRRYL
jgi:hypothetical protein